MPVFPAVGATYCKLNPSEGTLVGSTAHPESSVLASSLPAKGGDYECTVSLERRGIFSAGHEQSLGERLLWGLWG